jgi:hypothetical protein
MRLIAENWEEFTQKVAEKMERRKRLEQENQMEQNQLEQNQMEQSQMEQNQMQQNQRNGGGMNSSGGLNSSSGMNSSDIMSNIVERNQCILQMNNGRKGNLKSLITETIRNALQLLPCQMTEIVCIIRCDSVF